MKTKTINKILTSKITEWIDSVTDKSLRDRLRNGVIVTGGCITSMLLNEDVNDFDVYLDSKQLVKDLSKYYCNIFNKNNKSRSNGVGRSLFAWVLDGEDVNKWRNGKIKLSSFAHDYDDIEYDSSFEWDADDHIGHVSGMLLNTYHDRVKIIINSDGVAENISIKDNLSDADEIKPEIKNDGEYAPVYLSGNAITLTDKIQIVIRFYGDAKEIHSNYDFSHTTNYWTFDDCVVTNSAALEAILSKELFYNGSKYPLTSIIRTRKFIKRGWHINAGQYLKMCMQVSKIDLTNIYTLEDQLVGVDSLYFMQFLEQIRVDIEKGSKTKSDLIDNSYVMSVIDKIF